jgi:Lysophospholipase L1 and related esterases
MDKTKKSRQIISRSFAGIAALALALSAGCEGDGDDAGKNYGDNDPNLVACMGDSLTMGYNCEGDPYPTRLASITGKTVLDYGVGGVESSYGVSIVSSVIARKPAYVCIMYGSNDMITFGEVNVDRVKENLRRIIQACRASSCIPILATIPPMNASHQFFQPRTLMLSEAIRELAKEEGVQLVDINKAFGEGGEFINKDGLHFTDAGGEWLARKFASKIP